MTCCVVAVVDELVRRGIIAVECSVYFDTIRLEVVKDLSMGKRE